MKTLYTRAGICRGMVGLLVAAAAIACSDGKEAAPREPRRHASAVRRRPTRPFPPTTSPYDALPEAVQLVMDKPFTGDLDALVARRSIRVAVTFNRTHYFIDQGQERGMTYEP